MPYVDDLLAGSVAKLERAQHHLADLNDKADAFMRTRPCRLVHAYDPGELEFSLTTRIAEPVPREFGLIIGDTVHNLRAALDLVMFAMVGRKTESPDAVRFPFCRSAHQLPAAIRSAQANLAGSAVVDAIHQLEPYPGGALRLHDLHQIDITDTHRLLIPIALPAEMAADDVARYLSIQGGPRRIRWAEGASMTAKIKPANGRDESFWRAKPAFETETEWQPPFELCFASSQPFAHQNVLDVLAVLAEITAYAITKLAKAGTGHAGVR